MCALGHRVAHMVLMNKFGAAKIRDTIVVTLPSPFHPMTAQPCSLNDAGGYFDQVEDLSDLMAELQLPPPAKPSRPTCTAPVYDSEMAGNGLSPKRWYVVYTGRTPGIFSTWDDVSGRVVGVSGARHKSYKKLEDARHGWRQNCLAHHAHGDDFIDGSLYHAPVGQVPPRPSTPPPHVTPSSSQPVTPSRVCHPPTTLTSPGTPAADRFADLFFGASTPPPPRSPARPRRHNWAVSTRDRLVIVDSATADVLLDHAERREVPLTIQHVGSVTEAAEAWSRLQGAELKSEDA
ncbi:hypothetical protein D9758_017637 [Tetrapyrgos nigripes]|uniref:Ribonuclease H1 N-terminal domain-containing protein n=1 Tax=Tetrapyrgos nigripes TaxID=182062 RepID=A0A8H5CGH6_9AGAR|nr:hypothetical protein D9758_017637 [Tetrapyrgos nigripes]